MKFLARTLVFLFTAIGPLAAHADSLDINVHDEAMRMSYGLAFDRQQSTIMEAGALFREATDTAYHLGLLTTGGNWSRSGTFDIGVGARLFAIFPDEIGDFTALGLGGRVRYSPVRRVGIGAHIYHAPRIMTFMDGERYNEWGIRLDYQLLPQAYIYLGYRNIELDFEFVEDVEIEDAGHFGMKILF